MPTLTTQTMQTTKTLDHPNITDKKIEIQITWPTTFVDTSYTAVASCSSSSSTRIVPPNTFQEAGDRDREATGMLVVLNLLAGAAFGDTITVDAIAIGNV
jgi:hypothetical protein